MALGSQNNRIGITSRGGAAVHRQRRRRSILIVLGICLLAGAYLFWPGGEKADSVAGRGALPTVTTAPESPDATGATPRSATLSPAGPRSAGSGSASPLPRLNRGTDPASTVTPPPAAQPTVRPGPPVAAAAGITPAARLPDSWSATSANSSPAADGIKTVIDNTARGLPAPKPFTTSQDAKVLYDQADRLIAEGKEIEARSVLSKVLFADNLELASGDAALIRERLADLNQRLLFSPDIIEGDPITRPYVVDGALGRIGPKFRIPYRLIMLINGIADARNVQAGQTIKVIQGPLHARVTKHNFVMDVFAVAPDGSPVFVHTFPVGLGKDDKTPVGPWKVTTGKKVANPDWRDDEDGSYYASDNPDNPIGEYWIPIEGTNNLTKNKKGFGIHGTIDPDSIGTEASRGCIRLRDADIELVFNMLTDHSDSSTVLIRP